MAFELAVPETEAEAFEFLAGAGAPPAAALAGGTDLLLDVEYGRVDAARLVSLRRLPWRFVQWGESSVRIGSTAPLASLESDPELRRRIPGLHTAVGAVGGYALRHRATLGGNLARCAPASDLLPVLLALECTVELVGPAGSRELELGKFLIGSRRTALGPSELIRSVTVPARPCAYLWQRVRPANDISQVGVAAARRPDGAWTLAVGGIVPCPRGFPEAAGLLHGPSPGRAEIRAAADRASREAPFSTDKRATESYRRRLVAVLVERAVDAVVLQGGG
ncbi:MAG TPA: FAD binding domain-containing protein [Thermoplasmata archaeon]|nr:FAD binding domain-containing protein [Thermoplasmata archaeon]